MSTSSTSGARRIWTAEEDEQLRLLVSYWGDQCGKNGNWDKISSNFEHRSAKDCRKRWFHSLDPKLKRGRWSDAEDKVLIDAYARLGPSWQRISQLIPGRTDDQCSKRYNDVLDPSAAERLREWDPEEDAKLMELIDRLGTKWREICQHMDGRTGLTCRNRWRKLKKIQESKQDTQDTDSVPESAPDAHHQLPRVMPLTGVPPPLPQQNPHADVHYTISYDDPARYEAANPLPNPHMAPGPPVGPPVGGPVGGPMGGQGLAHSGKQYPIASTDLSRILDFCRENNQKIVIHQHVHNYPMPPAPVQPQMISMSPALEYEPQEELFGGSFANLDYLAFNPS